MADPIRGDSVYYIHTAQTLEDGDFANAFYYIGPNLYPVILLTLHKLGLSYELAGKMWGILVSTLTLLPLLKLVRIQFNGTIALVTGYLYAVHPRFIEWGPELMRDPTFWFCFVSTLYLLRRSYDSQKVHWFVSSGICFILAIHLRSEGWLLLIPIGVYAYLRCRSSRVCYPTGPVVRTALVLAIPVSTILLLNATWLRETPGWARLDCIAEVLRTKIAATATSAPAEQVNASHDQSHSLSHQLAYFGKKVLKGFVPWFVVPMAIGMYRLRRRMRSLEHAALLAITFIIVGLVAAYLFLFGEINTRYFLTGSLLILPYTAYGIIVLVNYLSRHVKHTWTAKPVTIATAITLFLLLGGIRGLYVDRAPLQQQADIGTWIRTHYGENAVVACWEDHGLVSYYAHAERQLMLPLNPVEWKMYFQKSPPAIVFSDPETEHGQLFREFVKLHPEFGYQLTEVASMELPPGSQFFMLPTSGTVTQPPHVARRGF